jgi:aminopeptidase N
VPQTAPAPDPAARLKAVADDVASALQFYSGLFAGPPGLKSLTVSPIPGNFGQGFPGLIYLSTLAYLNPDERPTGLRGQAEQVFYSDLIEAHEVAHQWWGGLVLPDGYQDEWIPEALASYSALLYLEKKKGTKAMEDVLADYRDHLLEKDTGGPSIESAGPITWGQRLESSPSPDAWRAITYDKGAWIVHMLRQRLGEAQFFKMLAELRRRFESRPVSTADLRALAKEFAPAAVKPASIDTFFDNWVYATGIPSLKVTYTLKGAAPAVRITGEIEQSGVDDDFTIEAPLEIQFAKGAAQTIWVSTLTGSAGFSTVLKQAPVKVTIPAGTSILAVK